MALKPSPGPKSAVLSVVLLVNVYSKPSTQQLLNKALFVGRLRRKPGRRGKGTNSRHVWERTAVHMDLDVCITFDYISHALLSDGGCLDPWCGWRDPLSLLQTVVLPLAEDTRARERMWAFLIWTERKEGKTMWFFTFKSVLSMCRARNFTTPETN